MGTFPIFYSLTLGTKYGYVPCVSPILVAVYRCNIGKVGALADVADGACGREAVNFLGC